MYVHVYTQKKRKKKVRMRLEQTDARMSVKREPLKETSTEQKRPTTCVLNKRTHASTRTHALTCARAHTHTHTLCREYWEKELKPALTNFYHKVFLPAYLQRELARASH